MSETPTTLKNMSMGEILKDAAETSSPVLRSESIIDPRKAPTLAAMTKHIPEYQRIHLKNMMPKKYWDKIANLGPPDVHGDPIEQTGNAACTYFWCNFVRTVVEPKGPSSTKLLDAEKAERVNIDRFAEMVKRGI